MELRSMEKIDKAFKTQTIIVIILVSGIVTAFLVNSYLISKRIDTLYDKVLVIDTKGNVYQPATVEAAYMRIYEYENHVRTFLQLWYAFDENDYEDNIKAGLELIGDKGKELLNEYNHHGMYGTLRAKNLRYKVSIKDIKIDINALPVSGVLVAVQTGYRSRASASRDMEISFTLYDVARSRENIHGVKIDKWDVKFSKAHENEQQAE